MDARRSRGALAITLALGCTTPWSVDGRLRARVVPIGIVTQADGTVQVGDWTLLGRTLPARTQRPHSMDPGLMLRETRSSLTLRASDGGVWSGDCQFQGSEGNYVVEAQAAMECDFHGPGGALHLSLSAYGARDFFALRQVRGTIEGVSSAGGATSSTPLRLSIDGTPRGVNVYRDREGVPYREATEGARCCASRDAIAAVSVWNPEALYLTPDLDPAPRVAVMLTAGALVSVRDVTAVPTDDGS